MFFWNQFPDFEEKIKIFKTTENGLLATFWLSWFPYTIFIMHFYDARPLVASPSAKRLKGSSRSTLFNGRTVFMWRRTLDHFNNPKNLLSRVILLQLEFILR